MTTPNETSMSTSTAPNGKKKFACDHCEYSTDCKDRITFTGNLLIALNPFQTVPLYSDDVVSKYQECQMQPPHIFSIGINALRDLKLKKKPQCIVITGVSGSGKSVTANYLTQFLFGRNVPKYAKQINTVLDAFGNCETTQNYNSSRFIKFLKLHPENKANNIQISYQLFEKSRLSMNGNTLGTNFNVFYLLLNAPTDLKKKLKITNRNFALLPLKEMCTDSENNFGALDCALDGLGTQISNMRPSIYAILASILHLGNVTFSTNDEGFAQINANDDSKRSIQYAADLLKIDLNELERVLLQQTITISSNRKDSVLIQFDQLSAMRTRDSLIKIIYSELFRSLVETINGTPVESQQCIAILDIAGFDEMEWYKMEAIDIPQIDFLDNQNVIVLVAWKNLKARQLRNEHEHEQEQQQIFKMKSDELLNEDQRIEFYSLGDSNVNTAAEYMNIRNTNIQSTTSTCSMDNIPLVYDGGDERYSNANDLDDSMESNMEALHLLSHDHPYVQWPVDKQTQLTSSAPSDLSQPSTSRQRPLLTGLVSETQCIEYSLGGQNSLIKPKRKQAPKERIPPNIIRYDNIDHNIVSNGNIVEK
ncbi:myosin heavy chain 95F-like [Sitodiplosis mosellana]|uniref:myosin heavy chain 95F-like n=1 Tax=Sitodiplosis mosellana TaxID=263140 RepID=UPI0024438D42|nr:myosin heavy chain 95F-like [Sitodiplosis mosellana]